MPPRMRRNLGSSDELNVELTGWEWVRLFKYMRNKWLYVLSLLLSFSTASSSYVISLIQGRLATVLVDSDFSTANEFLDGVNGIAAEMVIAIVVIFFCQLVTSYCESRVLPSFYRDIQVALVAALMDQEIAFFDEKQTGVLLSRLSEDIPTATSIYMSCIIETVRVVFQWISGLIIGLLQSWKVTLITLVCLPLYAVTERLGNSLVDKLYLMQNEKSTKVSAKAEEILTSFRTVKAFDAEMREYHAYKERLADVHETVRKTALVNGARVCASGMVHWGLTSFVLYYTGTQAAKGEIESGTIVTLMSILQNWSMAFNQIFNVLSEFKKANVSAAKLLDILERVPQIRIDTGAPVPGRLRGKIEFRNVFFKYATREDYALEDMSFVIQPGETVALVGESGCGKSTTLQLIQRFYDVAQGQVLIDEMDVRDLSPVDLRNQIAIVPQGPVMFSMNVKDNIRFGKTNATREEIVDAAKVANAHSFICQLKDGYKTKIHQSNLSGGQKQRICIARAVLMQAPILLLDEATAALDTESERLVQEALGNFKTGRTVVIVAHRLATVRHADRILVVEKGHVIESGTHEDLLAQGGAYAKLVQHQLQ